MFSSNWPSLDQKVRYTKFGAFAALYHGGNHGAAARALYERGFGDRHEKEAECVATAMEESMSVSDEDVQGVNTQDEQCASRAAAPEEGECDDSVTGIMRFVTRRLDGLPVEVSSMGLVVDLNASDKDFRQIIGRVLKVRNDVECPIQFALGDVYNALPRRYGERGAWVSGNFGAGYSF